MAKKVTEKPVIQETQLQQQLQKQSDSQQESRNSAFPAGNFTASFNKNKLREAVIWKEILDLPVGLR